MKELQFLMVRTKELRQIANEERSVAWIFQYWAICIKLGKLELFNQMAKCFKKGRF